MKILIACEESDEVRSRFEKMGFDAWSCDLQPSRNPNNKKHYQGNIFDILYNDWLCMIAFPPCTHLAVSGAAWFEQKRKDGRQQEAIDFFLKIADSNIKHTAIENPVGIMSKYYKKPTQIIQPYYFGDKAQKTTCLWLENLPLLYHNEKPNLFDDKITHVQPEGNIMFGNKMYSWTNNKWFKSKEERSRERSKTFPGIAEAMATQWGNYLIQKYKL